MLLGPAFIAYASLACSRCFSFKDAEPFELAILHGAFNARVSKEPECAPVHSA